MLKSGIYRPGTEVKVIDQGYGLLAESTAVIADVTGSAVSGSSLMKQNLVVTRRGKSGQARLDLKTVIIPTFRLTSSKNKEAEYYELLGKPSESFVRIEPIGNPDDLLKIPVFEFIAWASAISRYLFLLQKNYIDVPAKYVADGTATRMGRMRRVIGNYNDNYPTLHDRYLSTDQRIIFIEELRKAQSILMRCARKCYAQNDHYSAAAAKWLLIRKKMGKYKFSSLKELNTLKKNFGG